MRLDDYIFWGFIGFLFIMVIIAIVGVPILNAIDNRRIEKSRSKNVEFYAFHNEVLDKAQEFRQCDAELTSQKEEIDKLIARTKYAPKSLKIRLEQEIEIKKEMLYQFETYIYEPMKSELRSMIMKQEEWQKQLEQKGEKIYY